MNQRNKLQEERRRTQFKAALGLMFKGPVLCLLFCCFLTVVSSISINSTETGEKIALVCTHSSGNHPFHQF